MWMTKRETGPVRTVEVQVVMQFSAERKDTQRAGVRAKLGNSRGKFK
jgi:hypothetical protein